MLYQCVAHNIKLTAQLDLLTKVGIMSFLSLLFNGGSTSLLCGAIRSSVLKLRQLCPISKVLPGHVLALKLADAAAMFASVM